LFRRFSSKDGGLLVADFTTQSVLFPELFDRPLIARFDRPHASSDGGAVLLKAADRRLGLMSTLTACLRDTRDPAKVRHGLNDLFAQRVYGLACGYEDANDAARLADDPIHKLLLGRDAITGDALASQPTLSRFENGVTRGELLRMSQTLFKTVVRRQTKRLRGKVRTITIDLDVTDDPTHGQQELTFFHGHYGHWCYLPLLAYLTFNGEPDQHLVAAMLRPGNAPNLARCTHDAPAHRGRAAGALPAGTTAGAAGRRLRRSRVARVPR
jgi:hypothetical protein